MFEKLYSIFSDYQKRILKDSILGWDQKFEETVLTNFLRNDLFVHTLEIKKTILVSNSFHSEIIILLGLSVFFLLGNFIMFDIKSKHSLPNQIGR